MADLSGHWQRRFHRLHLVERLLADGHRVRDVLDDFNAGNRANLAGVLNRIELIEGSITDPIRVRAAVDECEIVYTSPTAFGRPEHRRPHDDARDLRHRHAPRSAGRPGRRRLRRVVYAGSARPTAISRAMFAARRSCSFRSPPTPPPSSQGACCTCVTEVYRLETVRLRFFNVFGPRQIRPVPIPASLPILPEGDGRRPRADHLQRRPAICCIRLRRQRRPGNASRPAGRAPKAVSGVYNVRMGTNVTLSTSSPPSTSFSALSFSPPRGVLQLGDVRDSRSDISAARRGRLRPTSGSSTACAETLEGTPGLGSEIADAAHSMGRHRNPRAR